MNGEEENKEKLDFKLNSFQNTSKKEEAESIPKCQKQEVESHKWKTSTCNERSQPKEETNKSDSEEIGKRKSSTIGLKPKAQALNARFEAQVETEAMIEGEQCETIKKESRKYKNKIIAEKYVQEKRGSSQNKLSFLSLVSLARKQKEADESRISTANNKRTLSRKSEEFLTYSNSSHDNPVESKSKDSPQHTFNGSNNNNGIYLNKPSDSHSSKTATFYESAEVSKEYNYSEKIENEKKHKHKLKHKSKSREHSSSEKDEKEKREKHKHKHKHKSKSREQYKYDQLPPSSFSRTPNNINPYHNVGTNAGGPPETRSNALSLVEEPYYYKSKEGQITSTSIESKTTEVDADTNLKINDTDPKVSRRKSANVNKNPNKPVALDINSRFHPQDDYKKYQEVIMKRLELKETNNSEKQSHRAFEGPDDPSIILKAEAAAKDSEEQEGILQEDSVFSPLVLKKLKNPSKVNLSITESIECIDSIVSVGKARINAAAGNDLLAVLGTAGSGKSTTVNYLCGCELKLVPPFQLDVIGSASGGKKDTVAKIGHNVIVSETIVPQPIFVEDQKWGNIYICDMPGFLENRGREISIANAVNTLHMISSSRSLRLLILINYNDLLASRGNGLAVSTRLLQEMVEDERHLKEFSTSILVGITRTTATKKAYEEQFKHIIQKDMKTVKDYFEQEGINLRYNGDSKTDQIIVIDPLETGESPNSNDLWELIQKLDPISDTSIFMNPSLDATDFDLVRESTQVLEEKMDVAWLERNIEQIEEFCQLLISLSNIGKNVAEISNQARKNILKKIRAFGEGLIQAIAADDTAKRLNILEDFEFLQECSTLDSCFEGKESVSDIIDNLSVRIKKEEIKEQAGIYQSLKGVLDSTFELLEVDFKDRFGNGDEAILKMLSAVDPELGLDQLIAKTSGSLARVGLLKGLLNDMELEMKIREVKYVFKLKDASLFDLKHNGEERLIELYEKYVYLAKVEIETKTIDEQLFILEEKQKSKVIEAHHLMICLRYLKHLKLNTKMELHELPKFGFSQEIISIAIETIRKLGVLFHKLTIQSTSEFNHRIAQLEKRKETFIQGLISDALRMLKAETEKLIKRIRNELCIGNVDMRRISRNMIKLVCLISPESVNEMNLILEEQFLNRTIMEAKQLKPQTEHYKRSVQKCFDLISFTKSYRKFVDKALIKQKKEELTKILYDSELHVFNSLLNEKTNVFETIKETLPNLLTKTKLTEEEMKDIISKGVLEKNPDEFLMYFKYSQYQEKKTEFSLFIEQFQTNFFVLSAKKKYKKEGIEKLIQMQADLSMEIAEIVQKAKIVLGSTMIDDLASLYIQQASRNIAEIRERLLTSLDDPQFLGQLNKGKHFKLCNLERVKGFGDLVCSLKASIGSLKEVDDKKKHYEKFNKGFQKEIKVWKNKIRVAVLKVKIDKILKEAAISKIKFEPEKLKNYLRELNTHSPELHAKYLKEINELLEGLVSNDSEIHKCLQQKDIRHLLVLLGLIQDLETTAHSAAAAAANDDGEYKGALQSKDFKQKISEELKSMYDSAFQVIRSDSKHRSSLDVTKLQDFMEVSRTIEENLLDFKAIVDSKVLRDEALKHFEERIKSISSPTTLQELKSPSLKEKTLNNYAFYFVKSYAIAEELNILAPYRQKVGRLLNGNDFGPNIIESLGNIISDLSRDPYCGKAALAVLDQFPQFRRICIELYNKKASNVDINKALKQLECEPPLMKENRQILKEAYAEFNRLYKETISNIRQYKEDKVKSEVQKLVKKINNNSKILSFFGFGSGGPNKSLDFSKYLKETAQLLAHLFGAWTYLDAQKFMFQGESDKLLQPHPTQVLGILRIIGIDEGGGLFEPFESDPDWRREIRLFRSGCLTICSAGLESGCRLLQFIPFESRLEGLFTTL